MLLGDICTCMASTVKCTWESTVIGLICNFFTLFQTLKFCCQTRCTNSLSPEQAKVCYMFPLRTTATAPCGLRIAQMSVDKWTVRLTSGCQHSWKIAWLEWLWKIRAVWSVASKSLLINQCLGLCRVFLSWNCWCQCQSAAANQEIVSFPHPWEQPGAQGKNHWKLSYERSYWIYQVLTCAQNEVCLK